MYSEYFEMSEKNNCRFFFGIMFKRSVHVAFIAKLNESEQG